MRRKKARQLIWRAFFHVGASLQQHPRLPVVFPANLATQKILQVPFPEAIILV
jgi:hypothetical protein